MSEEDVITEVVKAHRDDELIELLYTKMMGMNRVMLSAVKENNSALAFGITGDVSEVMYYLRAMHKRNQEKTLASQQQNIV